MKHIADSDYVQESLSYNIILMKIVGFYPPPESSGRFIRYLYTFYSIVCVYFFFMVLFTVFGVLTFVMEDVTIFSDANGFIFWTQYSFYCIKYFTVVFYPEDVQKTMFKLKDPVFTESGENRPECREMIEDCVKSCKQLVVFFTMPYVLMACGALLTPFLLQTHALPIGLWVPLIDVNHGQAFVWTYIYTAIVFFCSDLEAGSVDTLFTNSLLHIVTQIRILKFNLRTLHEYAEEQVKTTDSDRQKKIDEFIYMKLKKYVVHHVAIKKYVQLLENVYSAPLLMVQIPLAAFVVGATCVKFLVLDRPMTYDQVFSVCSVIVVSRQVFFPCYFGDLLYTESDDISSAAYMGHWYEYDTKSKKALILIMTGAKEPLMVRAGKMIDISLNTFSAIMRMASSIVTLISSFLD